MRRPLLALLAILLIWLCFWALKEDGQSKGSTSSHRESESSTQFDSEEGKTSSGLSLEGGDSESLERLDAIPVATDQGSSDAGDYRLTVVDAHDLSPLPGAEVYIQQDSQLREAWQNSGTQPVTADAIDTDEENVLGPFLADSLGSVSLPYPAETDLLVTRFKGAWGFRTHSKRSGWSEELLKVYPDRTLQVKAVDLDGNPIPGQQVGLFRGTRLLYARLSAVTDDQGIALIHAPRLHLHNQTTGSFYLGALIHGTEPRVGPFHFATIPSESTVVVQPTSSWRIRFQNADGSAFQGMGQITLQSKGEEPITMITLPLPENSKGAMNVSGLAPAIPFEATAYFLPGHSNVQLEATSPDAGRTEDLVFRLQEDPYRLSLRLLDDDSRPFGSLEAKASLWGKHEQFHKYQEMEGTTDAAGILEITFLPFDEKARQELKGRRIVAKLFDQEKQLWLRGEHPFHEDSFDPKQTIPMRLTSIPVLAGGRVVDTLGDPVAGISVVAQEAEVEFWPDTIGVAETNEDGRFLIQAPPPSGPTEIKVFRNGEGIPAIPLDPGSLEHRIEVQALPFEVQGTVLLPGFISLSGWKSHLEFRQGERSYGFDKRGHQGVVDFRIMVASDAPGELVLHVDGPGEVATLDSLIPQPLAGAGDPRLQPWDLRDVIPLAEVEVFLGSERLDDFQISVLKEGGQSESYERIKASTEWGPRYMLPEDGPVPARLTGSSIRESMVTLRPGKQTLQAEPALRATFQLANDLVIPEEFEFVLNGSRQGFSSTQSGFHNSNGPPWPVAFQVSGTWKCLLFLQVPTRDPRRPSVKVPIDTPDGEPYTVIVDFDEAALTFDIPLSQETLDSAVDRLRERAKGN